MIWLTMARPSPAPSFVSRATPEPFENVLTIFGSHATAAIGHLDPAGAIDCHGYFRSRRRMNDCVLDEISQRIFDRVRVSLHLDWLIRTGKRNDPLLGDRAGRHHGYNRRCDLVEIHLVEVERDGVQSGDAQELLDDPVHARAVGPQFLEAAVPVHRLEGPRDDRKRGAQLMSGIGSKLTLHAKTCIRATEGC